LIRLDVENDEVSKKSSKNEVKHVVFCKKGEGGAFI